MDGHLTFIAWRRLQASSGLSPAWVLGLRTCGSAGELARRVSRHVHTGCVLPGLVGLGPRVPLAPRASSPHHASRPQRCWLVSLLLCRGDTGPSRLRSKEWLRFLGEFCHSRRPNQSTRIERDHRERLPPSKHLQRFIPSRSRPSHGEGSSLRALLAYMHVYRAALK